MSNKKDIVLVDIDSTVLDFFEGLRISFARQGKQVDFSKLTDYDFNGVIGCKPSDCFELIKSVDTYKAMPLFKNVYYSLDLLRSKYNVKSYTKVDIINTENLICVERKNLLKRLGFTENQPKDKIDLNVIALFDDYNGIVDVWLDKGYNGFIYLINQPYNINIDYTRYKNVIRVDSFYEGVLDLMTRL